MVAFFLPPEAGAALYDSIPDEALPASASRIPTHKLHVTLAYLGDSTVLGSEVEGKVVAVLGDMASEWAQLDVVIRGTGTFEPKDGAYPFYATMDAESLAPLREELVTRLKVEGVELASSYDFNPHITIAYIPEGEPTPEVVFSAISTKFGKLALSWGEILSTYNLNGQRRPVVGEAKADLRRWRDKVIRAAKKGKTPGDIEFTPEHLSVPLYEAVKADLSGAEDIDAAKAVFDKVRDSFTPIGESLGKEAHRKGLTDLLVPMGGGQALPSVEVSFGESDADTTFWDVKLGDYAGLLTAEVVNRKSDEVLLITLLDGSELDMG